MPIRLKTALAALATVLLWGSAFPGIEAGLAAYDPGELALLRYLFASATMAVIALVRRACGGSFRRPRGRDLPGLFALGAVGFTIYHVALNYGQVTVTAGAASFLVQTAPVFAALLAAVFLGERLSGLGWIGLFVSLGGAALIASGEGAGMRIDPGALLVLLAALSGAVYFSLQKSYLRRYSPLEVTAYTLWAGTLLLGAWAPGLGEQVASAPPEATLAVAYIGVLPGAVAYATYTYVLASLPVALTASLIYLVPLAALPLAYLWLGEVPPPLAIVGGLITLGGVVLVQRGGTAEQAAEETTAPHGEHPAPTAGALCAPNKGGE